PGFQAMEAVAFGRIRAEAGYRDDAGDASLRHEKAGQLALPALLRGLGYGDARRRSAHPWYRVAQIVGGHHGRFVETTDRDKDLRYLGGGGWAAQRAALVGAVHETLGRPKPPGAVGGRAAVLIGGLVILADWLASQEHFLAGQLPRVPAGGTPQAIAAHLAALPGQ